MKKLFLIFLIMMSFSQGFSKELEKSKQEKVKNGIEKTVVDKNICQTSVATQNGVVIASATCCKPVPDKATVEQIAIATISAKNCADQGLEAMVQIKDVN